MAMEAQSDMSGTPTLSIVIVNSDGWDDTMACLESIHRSPPRVSYEVVVVDNCSRLPGLPQLVQRYPQVRTEMAPRRQGFAKNYNQGLRAARGAYLLVLNNDTLVPAGAIDALLGALRATPEYGMVGPMLVGRDGAIQQVCARALPTPLGYLVEQTLLDPGFPIGRLWQLLLSWRAQHRPSGPVPCISGACMLVSRADLEMVGMLDEGFDFYYEDVEWCHRFQRAGRRIGYVREARVIHLGDQSLSKVKVWAKRSELLSATRYFRSYYRLSSLGREILLVSTSVHYLARGLAMLCGEGLAGARGYAREYLYLWSWLHDWWGEQQTIAAGPSNH